MANLGHVTINSLSTVLITFLSIKYSVLKFAIHTLFYVTEKVSLLAIKSKVEP